MIHRYLQGDLLHPVSLKGKQRWLRGGFPTPLTLRVHRSLSWLRRAEAEADDLDIRFILLGASSSFTSRNGHRFERPKPSNNYEDRGGQSEFQPNAQAQRANCS